jgi:hypothetical protein
MRSARLQDALERLAAAIRDVESELAAMKTEHDPLASHIFVSRRHYRNVSDTKSGKRREMTALSSFNTACELGFRGRLDEWERLMGSCEAVNDRSTISGSCRGTQAQRQTVSKTFQARVISEGVPCLVPG